MAIPISDPDAISCKPKLSTIVSCSLLVIFWLYLLSWGIILIHLLLQDTGPWELDEWLISVTNLAGIIVIAAISFAASTGTSGPDWVIGFRGWREWFISRLF